VLQEISFEGRSLTALMQISWMSVVKVTANALYKIRRTEFALSALYNTDIITLIWKVDIDEILSKVEETIPENVLSPTVSFRNLLLLYDMIWYDMIWYIFNCNWVATQWQLFSTHVHTNNTGNVTEQTTHRTTQKYIEQHTKHIEQHNN